MTLPALNRQMRLQIMTGRFQTYADFQGLTELPAVFYVDEQGKIVFLFQQYAVGPYAAGFCPFHTGRQIRSEENLRKRIGIMHTPFVHKRAFI